MANTYRENVLEHLLESLASLGPLERALDFGAGDGWFAERLMATGSVREVIAVDVKPRSHSFVEPTIYDGRRLPFDDRQFDLVYSVDVLHHSDSPEETLRDALRCSREHFVLKDHTYETRRAKLLISILDELGNRRFGVPTPHRYQCGWEWLPVIEGEGFDRAELRHPIVCETRPLLSRIANSYQFIGRWRRAPVAESRS